MKQFFDEEIGEILERRIRIAVLTERREWLQREIAKIDEEMSKLVEGKISVRKRTKPKKPRKVAKKKTPSVRELAIEVFRARRRPMKVKEIADAIIKKGYKPTRKEFFRTVDNILRSSKDFTKIRPGTFILKKRR